LVGLYHSLRECSALATAAFLARFRAHLGLVEKAMGGLLVLTGIAFLTGAISEVSYWLLDTFPMLGKIG
jgi:cytochrome c-type biogenesis protein